jgi:hypothetical protein
MTLDEWKRMKIAYPGKSTLEKVLRDWEDAHISELIAHRSLITEFVNLYLSLLIIYLQEHPGVAETLEEPLTKLLATLKGDLHAPKS